MNTQNTSQPIENVDQHYANIFSKMREEIVKNDIPDDRSADETAHETGNEVKRKSPMSLKTFAILLAIAYCLIVIPEPTTTVLGMVMAFVLKLMVVWVLWHKLVWPTLKIAIAGLLIMFAAIIGLIAGIVV